MKKNAEATARRGSVVCCILLIDMLGNGYGIQEQNHVALLLGNKMPQGFTLGILYYSQGKIQFNPQKIATKGFSTDSVRV